MTDELYVDLMARIAELHELAQQFATSRENVRS